MINDLDAALEDPIKVVRGLDRRFWRPQHTVDIALARPEVVAAIRRDLDNSSMRPQLYYAFDRALNRAGYSTSCTRSSQEWCSIVRFRKRRTK